MLTFFHFFFPAVGLDPRPIQSPRKATKARCQVPGTTYLLSLLVSNAARGAPAPADPGLRLDCTQDTEVGDGYEDHRREPGQHDQDPDVGPGRVV